MSVKPALNRFFLWKTPCFKVASVVSVSPKVWISNSFCKNRARRNRKFFQRWGILIVLTGKDTIQTDLCDVLKRSLRHDFFKGEISEYVDSLLTHLWKKSNNGGLSHDSNYKQTICFSAVDNLMISPQVSDFNSLFFRFVEKVAFFNSIASRVLLRVSPNIQTKVRNFDRQAEKILTGENLE